MKIANSFVISALLPALLLNDFGKSILKLS
jgi:predicted permease